MGANSSYPDNSKNESVVQYCERTPQCDENPHIEYYAHLARANKSHDGCKHYNARQRPPNKRSKAVKYRKDLPVPKYLQLDTPRQEAPTGIRQPPLVRNSSQPSISRGHRTPDENMPGPEIWVNQAIIT